MLSINIFIRIFVSVAIWFPRSLGLWWIKKIGVNIEMSIVGKRNSSGLMNCSNMFMFMAGLVLLVGYLWCVGCLVLR